MDRVLRVLNGMSLRWLWLWGTLTTCVSAVASVYLPDGEVSPQFQSTPAVPAHSVTKPTKPVPSSAANPNGSPPRNGAAATTGIPDSAGDLAMADGGKWHGDSNGVPIVFGFLDLHDEAGADGVTRRRLGAYATYGTAQWGRDAGGHLVRSHCEGMLTLLDVQGAVYRFRQKGDATHTVPGVMPDGCLDGDIVTFEKQSPTRARTTWTRSDGVFRGEVFLRYERWRD